MANRLGASPADLSLRDVSRLIPFDDAAFQVTDPSRHVICVQAAQPYAVGADELLDLWWPAFREHCSYRQPSNDDAGVWRGADAPPPTPAGPHWSELVEASAAGSAHHVVVSLPTSGAIELRLILWRKGDPDFSDRDVQLLTLLRPHLASVYDRRQDAHVGTPELTVRQREILRLVSDGFTNGQIARRLGLSEATVRKHLENTYARLGVTNRTSAVSRARRYLRAS